MAIRTIGIIMNGVTGRMGTNQHLLRSLCAIRDEGGLLLDDGTILMPEPYLVGRNADRLNALAMRAGGVRWSTDLDCALAAEDTDIYFDAQVTDRRVAGVMQAIAAGKHIYCEKPVATSTTDAIGLYRAAQNAGVKHGVVQDKLFLPGLLKLSDLIQSGFFGRILSVRGEFGYWVFAGGTPDQGGDGETPQRPSWNYRTEDGGGIIVDMLCHWRYVLDNLFGEVKAVSCYGSTHIPKRWGEDGKEYAVTADDAAYATFLLEGGIVAQFNSSWCVRVYRDDLLTLQVDGTHGSAVAGLRDCKVQHRSFTPRPVWNPDEASSIDYAKGWTPVPNNQPYPNAFRAQWEMFLKHVASKESARNPFPWDLLEAAKGVQLAECGIESWRERRWIDVLPLSASTR